ncbi:MAG: hypothetical protein NVSMB48_14840 [Marmoricola sp.]
MHATGDQPLTPIHIPSHWADEDTVTFEQFCQILHLPQRTVRDWRRRRVGPTWLKPAGTGRLYLTVAELRRFVHNATPEVER